MSIPSNIVEGSARRATREYLNFLNIARASASEVAYIVDLAFELGFLPKESFDSLKARCEQLLPQLESLVQRVEMLLTEEEKARRPKPKA